LTLELRCYDPETQTATVTFTGQAPTGEGIDVPILDGQRTFVFVGHRDVNVVDDTQNYRIDPSVLGPPDNDGWHVRVRVFIAEDESASRDVDTVVVPVAPPPTPPTQPTPPTKPSPHVSHRPSPPPVLAVHHHRPPPALPSTGSNDPIQLVAVGLIFIAAGTWLIARRNRTPIRRNT
jgi:LPXTG-motif cell wall-anchored protein